MKIIADTNVLLRAVLPDEDGQKHIAVEALETADLVAVSVHALCELVWVMSRRYGVPRSDVLATVQSLVETHNIVVDRPAVEASLTMMQAGGDFADGVIAHDGRWLGGDTFVSFDRRAVKLVQGMGCMAHLLA